VKIAGNGSNALDFHIAFHLGHLAARDPTAYFHIISKDKGFGPLIQHLKTRGVFVGRVETLAEIPLVKVATAKAPGERVQVALNWLQQSKSPKPRSLKTLTSSIGRLFQQQLSAEDVAVIIGALAKQGHLSVAGTKVTYISDSAG
jgi:hypothetical protein